MNNLDTRQYNFNPWLEIEPSYRYYIERSNLMSDITITIPEEKETAMHSMNTNKTTPADKKEASKELLDTPVPPYDSACRVEPPARLKTCTCVRFFELQRVTSPGEQYKGALLLTLKDPQETEGEIIEQWLPKKLCCNLDLKENSVWVWEVFIDPILDKLADEKGISL